MEKKLALTPSQPLQQWKQPPPDFGTIIEYIIACPIDEVRLALVKRLRHQEIYMTEQTERIEILHQAIVDNGEFDLAAELLHSYITGAAGQAIAVAVEYILTRTWDDDIEEFSGDICNKLCTGWHDRDWKNVFTFMPSLKKFLFRGLGKLDFSASRQVYGDQVKSYNYFEPAWVEFKRALKVIIHLAPACEDFLPLLEGIYQSMRLGQLTPCNFTGEKNYAKLLAQHQIELQFSLQEIKQAIEREKEKTATA